MKYFIIVLIFLLAGCSLINSAAYKAGYTRLDSAQKDLAALQAKSDAQIKTATDKVTAERDGVVAQMRSNFQDQSNWVYKIFTAEDLNITRNRRDDVIYLSAQTALKVGLQPTVESILAINDSLKKELDETQTSNVQLQAQYAQAQTDAVVKQKALTDKEASVTAAEKAKSDIVAKSKTDLDAAQAKVEKAQNAALATEKARADDAQAIQALKTKLSLWAGLFAAIALAGCIWSPVFKEGFGIFSALIGFAAVALWYINGTVVLITLGSAVIVLAAWLTYKHYVLDKSHTALVNTVNDIATTNPPVYAAVVAPALAANATVYTKDAQGNITTVPDTSVTTLIDKTLMASDRK